MKSKLDAWYQKQSDNEKDRRREFGVRVREMRKERNLSKAEFATEIGLSAEMIARIETGKVSPEFPNLKQKLSKLEHRDKMVIV